MLMLEVIAREAGRPAGGGGRRSRRNADRARDGRNYDYSNEGDECDRGAVIASAVSSANYPSVHFLFPLIRVTGGLEPFPACIR